jgi:hypothetical protein
MRRNREVEKRAEGIQSFFNKINITKITDLASHVMTYNKDYEKDLYQAFGAYRTSFDSYTVLDQQRIMRYREYEQMCYVPELNGGLEIYADDATLYNTDDRVISVEADNNDLQEAIENLFFKSLDMNYTLWHIVFNTCKYGDSFYEIIPDNYKNPKRIKYIKFIPPRFVYRIEKDDNLIEFIARIPPSRMDSPTQMQQDAEEIHLKPWQIVHFKLDDKEFEPYGKSVLETGRLAFKQMKLIEDAMLIYRISRAPERRVFGIPVGTLQYREAMARVEDVKQRYRKTPWIDPVSGEINYKANPLSINDDYFVPKRPDGTGITIDTLPGGQQLGEIDDARFFKEKILRTMRIPSAYLTGEMTGDVAKTSLSSMDVRFAKSIERIQKMVVKGLEKLAIIELSFKRFSIEDMYNFQIRLTKPSKIYEMQELETFNSTLQSIQTALSLADPNGKLYLPKEWLYKNINRFNDEQISTIRMMQQSELMQQSDDKKAMEASEAQPTEAGGGLPTGVSGGAEMPGAEGGATPGPETGTEAGGAAPPEGELGTETTGGGEAGMEVASKIIQVAGKEFLIENETDIKELINFVKRSKEIKETKKDKLKPKLYENNFNNLFIRGELKGIIRRNKAEFLKD